MRGVTERTPLRRTDSPDCIEFARLLRTRRTRLRQFQCCVCGILIVVFTMALVVSISYSMSHTNSTIDNATSSGNLGSILRLGFAPSSTSHASFSNTASVTIEPNSIRVRSEDNDVSTRSLSHQEYMQGLQAGEQAMRDRLFADTIAAKLSSLSPESRHRYAMNTCLNVSALALAAVGEIAATRKIENIRSNNDEPSAIDAFFDSGWVPKSVCKRYFDRTCKIGKYRTIDGSCNRPRQWGSSLTPFRRVLLADYADRIESPRRARSGKKLPSAREVSMKIHKPSPSSNPSFTVMLAVFGQFLDHDITATALSQGINGSSIACCSTSRRHPECFPVLVETGDTEHDLTGKACMDFVRSAPAPRCKLGPREQLNQVSAFIDGSAIYGSDNETAHDLREFTGGRLRIQLTPDNRTLLPPSTNPNDGCNREAERRRGRYCFAAGDARANENLHLTTMHLLWVRQHNRIANELARINPSWSDDTLYQETRRIVGAQLQHITYREFLPIVLGNERMNERDLKPLSSGYKKRTDDPDRLNDDPTIANNFAAAAFRFAHTLLPGLMRITNAEKGTSSYMELHKMLFNPYSLYAEDGVRLSVNSATTNVIQRYSTHVTSQLTRHLFEDPMSGSTAACGLDLVSLNIQRGRDHGLPGYTVWREYCGLGKVRTFGDLEEHLDHQALEQMSMLYESVDDIDLYTAALAEIPESGSLIGPTFTCLIVDQFVRLQRGDRFWYEYVEQPYPFTKDQLVELRKSSLAKLICDCSDGITHAQMEIMRSVGPDNSMISCEDIPGPSFAPWREDRASHFRIYSFQARDAACSTDVRREVTMEGELKIIVKWSGKEYDILDIQEEDTVLTLKERIHRETGVRPERQKLLNLKFKGKAVQNEDIIGKLELKPGFKLMLMGSREEDIEEASQAPENVPDVINDLDIEEEEVEIEKAEINLRKIQIRIDRYMITELNPLREGKKLLVLDIDYTLFDHKSVAESGAELMRPYLHQFLTRAYKYYDIVIWSATSMRWINEKMKLLGVSNHPNYKIAFHLDVLAMITVHTPKYGVVGVKPLGIIWGKYKQFSAKNTIMFDDIRRNFIMNPQSGLRIRPFKHAHTTRVKDVELVKLSKYLELIAKMDDFQTLNHSKWEEYKAKKSDTNDDE